MLIPRLHKALAVGFCGSMATVLLTAVTKGQRYALPHATVHMHPTGGGAKGYTEYVRIAYKEQERLQNQVYYLIAKYSGHAREEVEEIFRRDHFFNAVQAKDYGLVDEVPGDAEDLITIEYIKCKIQFQAGSTNRESVGFKIQP